MVRRRLFRLDRVSFGEAFRWARMVERREGPAAAALACDIMYASAMETRLDFLDTCLSLLHFSVNERRP